MAQQYLLCSTMASGKETIRAKRTRKTRPKDLLPRIPSFNLSKLIGKIGVTETSNYSRQALAQHLTSTIIPRSGQIANEKNKKACASTDSPTSVMAMRSLTAASVLAGNPPIALALYPQGSNTAFAARASKSTLPSRRSDPSRLTSLRPTGTSPQARQLAAPVIRAVRPGASCRGSQASGPGYPHLWRCCPGGR